MRILPSCGMYPIMTIRQISDASQGSRIPAKWDVGIGTSRLSSTRTPFDDSVRRGHPTGIIEPLGLNTLRGYEGLDKAYPRLEACHIDHPFIASTILLSATISIHNGDDSIVLVFFCDS